MTTKLAGRNAGDFFSDFCGINLALLTEAP